jgi:hypothetical protein
MKSSTKFTEEIINEIADSIHKKLEYKGFSEEELNRFLSKAEHPVTEEKLPIEVSEVVRKNVLEKFNYKESFSDAVLVPISRVHDPRLHEEWYREWLKDNDESHGSFQWHRLRDYIGNELTKSLGGKKSGRIVKSIDSATGLIMRSLPNPRRKDFDYKGLVLGYVQSGKTANFTALIAKAVDAGYKIIIVLAGIHNNLRKQTQIRLDRELTGVKEIETNKTYNTVINVPGRNWERLTNYQVKDFDNKTVNPLYTYTGRKNPLLIVAKKNVHVLNKLIDYFKTAPKDTRDQMPVLLIDDEADQASIDTNANRPDINPTQTNKRIREILNLFSRRAYVGYTATPFANVLIGMNNEHLDLGFDLYPRNFIISLEEPEGYFGPSTLFQSDLSENFIVEVPDDEQTEVLGDFRMTVDLSKAIDSFLFACAIRSLRGDESQHASMLVHVSHLIKNMEIMHDKVYEYVDEIKIRLRTDSVSLANDLLEIYTKYICSCNEIIRKSGLKNKIFTFEDVLFKLNELIESIEVLNLNSKSDDSLDYSGKAVRVVAVGGGKLSRGLTLEGLIISYYLRTSSTYDTLLQMGRWFGYRGGYEDLTRIYTTKGLADSFEHLALVEQELRHEISRYEEEELTPSEMAVAIRSHQDLQVTARNKMGSARLRSTSYSNTTSQTTWLPLDNEESLRQNYTLASDFISYVKGETGFRLDHQRNAFISNSYIRGQDVLARFLSRYKFVNKEQLGGPGLDSQSLIDYITRKLDGDKNELSNWRIGIVTNKSPKENNLPVSIGGITINPIQRSRRLTESGFNVGVLTEPDHKKIGLDNSTYRPPDSALLLIYVIWKGSKAQTQNNSPLKGQRVDLFYNLDESDYNVVGLAIHFPLSPSEPHNYIGQS